MYPIGECSVLKKKKKFERDGSPVHIWSVNEIRNLKLHVFYTLDQKLECC